MEKTKLITISSNIFKILIRLLASTILLGITAFFTIGFTIESIWSLIFAVIFMTLIDLFLVKTFNLNAIPFGRGIVGFLLFCLLLYSTGLFITGYSISILSSFFAAIIYGIVDYLIT